MSSTRKRLAIIGCGSSGLISLKSALDILPNFDIVCFEKTDSITGCWGNPYPRFVSTSTRYTTQFACFPICDASVTDDGGQSRTEFFRDGEYGEYLESFADEFNLRHHIRLQHSVSNLQRLEGGRWQLSVNGTREEFDAVIVSTGLAAKPKPIASNIEQLSADDLNLPGGLEAIREKTIVVIGGGESAVDYADRLARKDLNNKVYLSLHSGIRVSPRYHPVRGVPSDFLRNRLMLSVHPDVRNWIGQAFVELRIKYQRQFQWLFPHRTPTTTQQKETPPEKLRKEWALKLTMAAKDELFNMFHNKSDDFLDAVGDQRINIIGTATEDSCQQYHSFDADETFTIEPDLLVPAIGYESTLGELTNSKIGLQDFYLGCAHAKHRNLFLVGFARPIIGNIPTISEVQARFACGLIAGSHELPANVVDLHRHEQKENHKRYAKLNLNAVHPVEMFPYCDHLARLMKLPIGPSLRESILGWWRCMLAPATTMHYFPNEEVVNPHKQPPIYMPPLLIAFLLVIKPIDWLYRMTRRLL